MNKFLSILSILLILQSCSSDDSPDVISKGDYDQGFFVLNEGGTGSVTYVSQDFTYVEQNVFEHNNQNSDLGTYVQSIFFQDDLAFIISNGSNLITVVNRYTFQQVGVVDSGLEVPRYGVILNGKAYVTNQGSFQTSDDDYVAVINTNTFEVENTIIVGKAVEYIQTDGTNLFVQNAAYGFGNEISIINPNSETIIDTIETNAGLSEFEISGANLYALTASSLETLSLTNLELTNTVNLNYSSSPRHLEVENNIIYYTVANKVFKMQISESSAPQTAIVSYDSQSQYGVMYGFNVHGDKIFIADGGDFASNSFIELYDTAGSFLFSTNVGIAPNGFYFNY